MAAALVVADHGMLIVPFAHVPWQSNVGQHVGFFAMSLFFVLSGFVIYLNYAPEFRSRPMAEATFNFAVARFARLYPLYAVFMAFTLASVAWARVPPMFPDLYGRGCRPCFPTFTGGCRGCSRGSSATARGQSSSPSRKPA
jgi:peptidoglycan/LPS O-acetylase OafA/YrhL